MGVAGAGKHESFCASLAQWGVVLHALQVPPPAPTKPEPAGARALETRAFHTGRGCAEVAMCMLLFAVHR